MSERILVVEGEKRLRDRYQIELRNDGYEVITAASGQNALHRLKNESIDLIVAELVLPDGTGLGYLQKFLAVKRKVKVVINTSHSTFKTDFHSWAADAFLTKSSDLSELKSTIHSVLNPL
jgi:DNA-binding NtrC family response regulator